MAAAMRARGRPALHARDRAAPSRDCDLLGITLPYELTYTNVLEALDLAGIPLRAADRGDGRPARRRRAGRARSTPSRSRRSSTRSSSARARRPSSRSSRRTAPRRPRACRARETLEAPRGRARRLRARRSTSRCRRATAARRRRAGARGAPRVVAKRVLPTSDASRPPTCPVVPFMDVVHDRATVEVLRGCTRGCRFCQAGMVYRPVRERTADAIVRDALAALDVHRPRGGLADVAVHAPTTRQIEDVVRRLSRAGCEGSGVSVSLPSLRVDAFGRRRWRACSAAGKKSGPDVRARGRARSACATSSTRT